MSYKTEAKLLNALDFISDFIDVKGYPPSVREMCNHLKVKSTATVQYYLNKLEDMGYIKKDNNKNRCIEVLSNPNRIKHRGVPVVGKVAAGTPITAVENIDNYIELPKPMFDGNDLFILNVKGTSMINAGIFDGDKIIVRKQSYAKNGDKVIALIDDSATVKTFYREAGYFRLQPENDTMEPIIVDEVEILGIVVGLIRKY